MSPQPYHLHLPSSPAPRPQPPVPCSRSLPLTPSSIPSPHMHRRSPPQSIWPSSHITTDTAHPKKTSSMLTLPHNRLCCPGSVELLEVRPELIMGATCAGHGKKGPNNSSSVACCARSISTVRRKRTPLRLRDNRDGRSQSWKTTRARRTEMKPTSPQLSTQRGGLSQVLSNLLPAPVTQNRVRSCCECGPKEHWQRMRAAARSLNLALLHATRPSAESDRQ